MQLNKISSSFIGRVVSFMFVSVEIKSGFKFLVIQFFCMGKIECGSFIGKHIGKSPFEEVQQHYQIRDMILLHNNAQIHNINILACNSVPKCCLSTTLCNVTQFMRHFPASHEQYYINYTNITKKCLMSIKPVSLITNVSYLGTKLISLFIKHSILSTKRYTKVHISNIYYYCTE